MRRAISCLLAGAACLALSVLSASAAPARSPDGVWRVVPSAAARVSGPLAAVPQQLYLANEVALRRRLERAPDEATGARGALLTLPMPDASYARFRVLETAVMAPALAARYPRIKTYVAYGLSDPTATARLDLTPAGFHAMILSGRGVAFIDPVDLGKGRAYRSLWKHDAPRVRDFRCEVADQVASRSDYGPGQEALPSGTQRRTYRLAMAATGEYTQFHGGTVPLALAAIVTSVNRVNGIYERDAAIRLVLIANTDQLIYTDGTTDPYTNNDGGTMLGQNQANVDAVIGSANYDIGHVFSTGGGGIATLGCVCGGGKARGVTGSGAPVGDPFDVDYVAHEMGHQFAGNHTFNGTTSNCGGGNRVAGAAYEPGSGTTIMAYAGICGAEDIQPHSDDYFHTFSLDEITNFRDAGGSCGVASATGDNPPSVNAGPDYTIPTGTPFILTATGSDPDGDSLTYAWEQMDLGAASPPPNSADGPLFRSRAGTASPSRTFPRLADILSGAATPWEILPSVSRLLNFRVTARDNEGGVATDGMQINATGVPFRVTAPNGGETLACGCDTTVSWEVGGGSVAPSVNILLSTDGGLTFPQTLAAATPNDGSEAVTLPCTPGASARVKLEPVGNIFFDISDANFSLVEVPPTVVVDAIGGSVDAACQGQVTFTATVTDDCRVSLTDVSVLVSLLTGNATLGPVSATPTQVDDRTVTVVGSVPVSALTSSPAIVEVRVNAADVCGGAAFSTDLANVFDDMAPVVTCPAPAVVECTTTGGTPASDPQLVPFFAGVSAVDNCDASPVIGNDAPVFFPLGTTPVTFSATDDSSNVGTCGTSVTVADTTPPQISLTLDPTSLWPPNHKLIPIHASVSVSDICDPAPTFVLTSITSSEPDNGPGDGNTTNDIQDADYGTPDTEFRLRAERAGGGTGRIYTVTYTASDSSGNTAQAVAFVLVPHDQR